MKHLELACVALLNSYHSLPGRNQGVTVKKCLASGIQVVLESAARFAKIMLVNVGKKYPSVNDHPLGKLFLRLYDLQI